MEMSLLSWGPAKPLILVSCHPCLRSWAGFQNQMNRHGCGISWWGEPSMHLKSMALTTVSHRLRSVKMEQRKLSDQANTLVDLSKVSGRIQRPHKGFSDAGLSSAQVWL